MSSARKTLTKSGSVVIEMWCSIGVPVLKSVTPTLLSCAPNASTLPEGDQATVSTQPDACAWYTMLPKG